MKNDFLKHRPQLRRYIRYTEIVVVLVPLVFAGRTYHELHKLRATPVILPSFWFNVAGNDERTSRVQARGSWVGKQGASEFLHTTSIECIKAKMQCVESSAVVSVSEGGFIESVQTFFEVETWTDTEIVTKSDVQSCASRVLKLDIVNKKAQAVVSPFAEKKNCKGADEGEQIYNLVTGPASKGNSK